MLNSYSNSDNEYCNGGHCESFPSVEGPCDNEFMFCLRVVGSTSCLTPAITSEYLEANEIMFTEDDLATLGISNPLQFFGIATTVCLSPYHILLYFVVVALLICNMHAWFDFITLNI